MLDMATYLMAKKDSDVDVESLNVSENGTYTAPSGKAYSPVSVNVPSDIGIVPFGTCSSAADAVAKTVTVTNFPGLVDGATIIVLFENTNTARNPTLNVNNSGAQPIMRTIASAVGIIQTSSWTSEGALVSLIYVQNTGWMLADYTPYAWVSQNNSTSNSDYRVLLGVSTDGNTPAYKSGNLTFNPSTKQLGLSGKLILKSSNLDAKVAPNENKYADAELDFYDLNGDSALSNRLGCINIYKKTDNTTQLSLVAQTRNAADTENINNTIGICINRDGTKTYTVGSPAAFCDAIGLGSVLQDISNIQATIGDINTVLEEVL